MDLILENHIDKFLVHLFNAVFLGLIPVLLFGVIVGFIAAFRIGENSDRRLVYAFSFVGAACGIMIGASRSNVVDAFLPALLTLVTTFLAYSYVYKDSSIEKLLTIINKEVEPSNDEDSEELIEVFESKLLSLADRKYIPNGIVALVLSSVASSFYGASIRTQSEIEDYSREKRLIEFKQIQVPLEKNHHEARVKDYLKKNYDIDFSKLKDKED